MILPACLKVIKTLILMIYFHFHFQFLIWFFKADSCSQQTHDYTKQYLVYNAYQTKHCLAMGDQAERSTPVNHVYRLPPVTR